MAGDDGGTALGDLSRRGYLALAGGVGFAGGASAAGLTAVADANLGRASGAGGGNGDGSAGSARTVHVDEFGADPTGESASDAALRDAVEAAESGERVAMTGGSYLLEEHNELTTAVTLDARGSTVECTRYNGDKETLKQSELYGTEEAVVWFSGRKAERAHLTAPAGKHDDQVEVTDPAPFEAGDDVLVVPQAKAWLNRLYEPTRSTVRAVDGETLYLTTPLKYDYGVSDDVHRLEALVEPRVVGGTWTGDADSIVTVNYARDAEVRDVHVESYRRHAFQTVDSLRTRFVDCSAGPAIDLHGSHGETFRIGGSSDVWVVRPVVRRCRRAVDLRSGCKTLYVLAPKITGVTLLGFSYHNSSEIQVRGNMEVRGGFCSASPTDETLSGEHEAGHPWEYQGGWIAGTTRADGHARYYGVHMVGREATLTGDGTDVLLDGCTLATAESGAGTAVATFDGAGQVGSDLTVHAGGSDRALEVVGSDVSVSGRVRGQVRQSGVLVDGSADRVDLDLDVQVDGERAPDGVRVGTARNVTVRDSYVDAPGRAVAVEGIVKRFTVTDSDLGGDADAGAVVATPGSVLEGFRLVDTDLTVGENHDVAFEGTASGIWVESNRLGSVRVPDDAENVVVRDNLTGR